MNDEKSLAELVEEIRSGLRCPTEVEWLRFRANEESLATKISEPPRFWLRRAYFSGLSARTPEIQDLLARIDELETQLLEADKMIWREHGTNEDTAVETDTCIWYPRHIETCAPCGRFRSGKKTRMDQR